jgi:hypothetical protein
MKVDRLAMALAASMAFVFTGLAGSTAQAEPECTASGVCVDGATWNNGETLDDRARARERSRNKKRKNGTLTVTVQSGRASVFVDGVWVALAPANYVPIKPGKHDIQVRDGQRVLATGVVVVPRNGGDVEIKVP